MGHTPETNQELAESLLKEVGFDDAMLIARENCWHGLLKELCRLSPGTDAPRMIGGR